MIEVMNPSDIEKITSPKVQRYLHARFKEIAYAPTPDIEGYFLVIDDFTQLNTRQKLTHVVLPSIAEGLLQEVEAVTMRNAVVEISLLFNNEFLLSLILIDLSPEHLSLIMKEAGV